eukprot:4309864-Pyramimonas_sp.AAC.1
MRLGARRPLDGTPAGPSSLGTRRTWKRQPLKSERAATSTQAGGRCRGHARPSARDKARAKVSTRTRARRQ